MISCSLLLHCCILLHSTQIGLIHPTSHKQLRVIFETELKDLVP